MDWQMSNVAGVPTASTATSTPVAAELAIMSASMSDCRERDAVDFLVASELIGGQDTANPVGQVGPRCQREMVRRGAWPRDAMERRDPFKGLCHGLDEAHRCARLTARHLVGVVGEQHRPLHDGRADERRLQEVHNRPLPGGCTAVVAGGRHS